MPCRFWGGPERQTVRAAKVLRARGACDITFAVMPHKNAPVWDNPLLLGARAEGLDAELALMDNRYNPVEGARLIQSLVQRIEPDVVCTVGYKANVLAVSLRDGFPRSGARTGARSTRPRVIAVARGWTGEDPKVRLFEWMDRSTLRYHDAVIVVSEAQRALVRTCGVSDARIFTVLNAIDPTSLQPPMPRARLLGELGVPEGALLVGAVGRISPEKGQRVLVDAFGTIARRNAAAHLVLVGDGPDERLLRGVAQERGLADRIHFMGLRRDGAEIIGALDLLALPSHTEAMPNVVLEAFAYRTPVVASRVGGVPELVREGDTGWLVPAGQPEALAERVLSALGDLDAARACAARAHAYLEERFTVDRQADSWLDAFRAVLSV